MEQGPSVNKEKVVDMQKPYMNMEHEQREIETNLAKGRRNKNIMAKFGIL